MSEYQYYEFLALDRPLTQRQMAELRKLTTRAEITPNRLQNVYHWGDFKGDPLILMERYFDAHVYVANYGRRGSERATSRNGPGREPPTWVASSAASRSS